MSDDNALAWAQRLAALETRIGRAEVAERGPAWGAVAGAHLLLPGLRAFWPFSSIDENADVRDLSAQGRTIADTGGPSYAIYNERIIYVDLNGTTQWMERASEAALNITSNLTLGGWFWLDTIPSNVALISKLGAAGNYAYELFHQSGNGFGFQASSNGTALASVTVGAPTTAGAWRHVVARYTPSTELALFVDGTKYTNTTSIPASLYGSSTANFLIGARGDAAARIPLDGRACMCFLCAAALPDSLIQGLNRATKLFFQ